MTSFLFPLSLHFTMSLPLYPPTHTLELTETRFNWANENLLASDWNQNKAIEIELKKYIWILDTHFHLDTKKRSRGEDLFWYYKLLTRHNCTLCLVSGREHNFSFWLKLNLCGFLVFATDYSGGQPLKRFPVILTFGYSTLCNSFSWNVHWIY